MKIHGRDRICRHLASPGSATKQGSQFGKFMEDNGIRMPGAVSLRTLTDRGWLAPVLRVPLPPEAINSWLNFPQLSMQVEECPEAAEWALHLWVAAHTMPRPRVGPIEEWSIGYLDDSSNPTTAAALNAATRATSTGATPPFTHKASGREAPSYIDFFAYWQALQVAELIDIACISLYSIDGNGITDDTARQQAELTQRRAEAAALRWSTHSPVFECLSRFRTLLANWAASRQDWSDAVRAVQEMANRFSITADTVATGLRDTLLVLWSDWTRDFEQRHPTLRAALKLLQDDIAQAVHLLEMLTGDELDPTDPFWMPKDRQRRPWSTLLDALPREDWLARASFSDEAARYLRDVTSTLGSRFPLDSPSIEAIVQQHWRSSRPLRRLCFALNRLHRELGNDGPAAAFDWRAPIRQKERIEQLLLLPLHAERLLSAIHRKQAGAKHYPDVRRLARARLDRALHIAEVASADRVAAIARLDDLLKERAQLHERDFDTDELFVDIEDVEHASEVSRTLVTAHANFVIARNYAAHHDALDADLVFPTDGDPTQHAGRVAIASTLLVVMCAAQEL